ncbi:hypothetical protein MC7420_2054 [Coleofasciculus chthonoplastes PCC 7420]|uniref:Uncharacterized protein n=1 Tax=Coleofasciculus chthonoplastes PCC 7420 TaxID=118168 RepID=B4VS83_9CYAN|nr:hypothetical protein MC7420_2054 [Coleofasciculus chthonoplastes PCC 7420]
MLFTLDRGGFSRIWVRQESLIVKPAPTHTPGFFERSEGSKLFSPSLFS